MIKLLCPMTRWRRMYQILKELQLWRNVIVHRRDGIIYHFCFCIRNDYCWIVWWPSRTVKLIRRLTIPVKYFQRRLRKLKVHMERRTVESGLGQPSWPSPRFDSNGTYEDATYWFANGLYRSILPGELARAVPSWDKNVQWNTQAVQTSFLKPEIKSSKQDAYQNSHNLFIYNTIRV